jgi:uncharacterized protein
MGDERHLPQAAAIEAYGRGGFRFADMSHRGSIVCLPSGIWAWPVTAPGEITEHTLARALASRDMDLFLIGSGKMPWMMPDSLRWRFREARIGVEVMPTPPAVRTYNILFGERRRVGAALIAVD